MRLIDADELLEHAYRDRLDTRERIADMIRNAPTVKTVNVKVPIIQKETVPDFADRCRECGKVKRGKWKVLDWEDEIYTNVAVCSVCDEEVINNGKDKFCPNCGASMEVDE